MSSSARQPINFSVLCRCSSSSTPSFSRNPVQFTPLQNPTQSEPRRLIGSTTVDPPIFRKSALERISDKLRSLGYVEEDPNRNVEPSNGRIVDNPTVPVSGLPSCNSTGSVADTTWSTPENPEPMPGSQGVMNRIRKLRDMAMEEKGKIIRLKRDPSKAQLLLSPTESHRLYALGITMKKKVNVGKAGLTQRIVRDIHDLWKYHEVVKIKYKDSSMHNKERTHALLEGKTGGIIVWSSGSMSILYRGLNYSYPPNGDAMNNNFSCQSIDFSVPSEEQIAIEGDILLDGLGPRYSDWWGCAPLPVDADLLPFSSLEEPLRTVLPHGVHAKLSDTERRTLKNLYRFLPYQFALGKNRGLHGLAAAILKIWERCEIAKVIVKRGIPHLRAKIMARELKLRTGGILLECSKELIILYRGKNFLPGKVSAALREWRRVMLFEPGVVDHDRNSDRLVRAQWELYKAEESSRITRMKLSMALKNTAAAANSLMRLQKREVLRHLQPDKEDITVEERYILRSLASKIYPFRLGRYGIFEGTLENVHKHWKHRELVKVELKAKSLADVGAAATVLAEESGGILVSVESLKDTCHFLLYRGKNYECPTSPRPPNLLRKRQAEERFLQSLRLKSLERHVSYLTASVDQTKWELEKCKESVVAATSESVHSPLPSKSNDQNTPTLYRDLRTRETSCFLREERGDDRGLSYTVSLSIPDRLRLRKIALKMKDPRVIFAGAKSAESALRAAVRKLLGKHPFAIVDVRGRPKGTSVQEVAFNLQCATGAVLVSEEPNKIILYRGCQVTNVGRRRGEQSRFFNTWRRQPNI